MYGSGWAVCLVLLGAPGRVAPAPPDPVDAPALDPNAQQGVEIALVGAGERRAATREVLDELLSHLSVDVAWHESASIDVEAILRPAHVDLGRLAHVHVDLADDGTVMIYVADRGYERILVRPVPLPAGFDEVAREQVGAIVSSAVEALLEGAEIGISRRQAQAEAGLEPEPEPTPPAPAPEPEPNPEPKPAARTRAPWLALGLGYGLDVWRPESIGHGPVLRVSVGTERRRLRFGGLISGGFLVPQTVGRAVLPTRVTGVSLRAGATVRGRVATRVDLLADLALGNDLLWTQGQGGQASWSPIPMIEAGGGPGLLLPRGLRIDVALSLAVDLVDTRILTQDDIVVLDPWRARPGVRVRLAWDVLRGEKKSGPN